MDIYNAQSVSGATFTAMDGDSLIDNAKDFLDAAGSQAVAINADLNPFSEQNRKTTFIVAGVALVLWFVGPPLIKAYFSARSEGSAKGTAPTWVILPACSGRSPSRTGT